MRVAAVAGGNFSFDGLAAYKRLLISAVEAGDAERSSWVIFVCWGSVGGLEDLFAQVWILVAQVWILVAQPVEKAIGYAWTSRPHH